MVCLTRNFIFTNCALHVQCSSDSINKRLKLDGNKVFRDGWDLLLGLNHHNFLNWDKILDLNLFEYFLNDDVNFGRHKLNRLFRFHNFNSLNRHKRHNLLNVFLIDEVVVFFDPAVNLADNLLLGLVQIFGQLVHKVFELFGGIIVLFNPAVILGIKLVFDGTDVFW